jgi:hypothetical protein
VDEKKGLVESFHLMYKNLNAMHHRAALLRCLIRGLLDVLKVSPLLREGGLINKR